MQRKQNEWAQLSNTAASAGCPKQILHALSSSLSLLAVSEEGEEGDVVVVEARGVWDVVWMEGRLSTRGTSSSSSSSTISSFRSTAALAVALPFAVAAAACLSPLLGPFLSRLKARGADSSPASCFVCPLSLLAARRRRRNVGLRPDTGDVGSFIEDAV